MVSKMRSIGLGFAIMSCGTALGQVTARVSVDSSGAQGNAESRYGTISADGRYVAFESSAANLVAGDTNGAADVFVRDRQTGTTERVSVGPAAVQGNGGSFYPAITADGRYVVFWSLANNLAADTNAAADVFVRDRQTGTTQLVSLNAGGAQVAAAATYGSISDDGRYVTFSSSASNFVGGDTNGAFDVFVRDRQNATTERVSVDSSEAQADSDSDTAWISADGSSVAFMSFSTNLVAGDTNGVWDVFVRDLQAGTTERVSTDSAGVQGSVDSFDPSISGDGRYVVFWSTSSNLVAGDVNALADVFLRDRQLGTTVLASVSSGGAQGNQHCLTPWISADGRFVAFPTFADNLVLGDTNGKRDVFLRDTQNSTTEMVSVSSAGVLGDAGSLDARLSADGSYRVFSSSATNFAAGDTNGEFDVFVRDPLDGPSFTTLCEPGLAGVIGCPCSNPPSGAGRGCNNSAATGGAILSASGGTYLSSDSLLFTTSGERPMPLSIVLQGNVLIPAGVVYGQGVRCAGGALKRLYTKTASGGSITAPDFGAGDQSVSARSAAKGDPISAGQSRWYLVYYRDPFVLGGCPAISSFNATQGGEVAWSF